MQAGLGPEALLDALLDGPNAEQLYVSFKPTVNRWLLFNASDCVPRLLAALAAQQPKGLSEKDVGGEDSGAAIVLRRRQTSEVLLRGAVASLACSGALSSSAAAGRFASLPDVSQVRARRGR